MILSPVELRHLLHKNPELSFKEFETTKLIYQAIKAVDKNDKLKVHTPYPTGLLVEYKVNDDEEFLLFRGDIDALPIKEETGYKFASENEFMHACGHDIHTSILYSFLTSVLQNEINHNILFLFQPAEESGGGAMEFYSTGIFNNYKISNAFALHVSDEYPKNTIASTSGILFASSLELDIDFYGVSSHVAFPYDGKNAMNALRLFMDSVDQIPKNISDPLVFGMGKITAGEVRNIVPSSARVEGTLRGLNTSKVLDFYQKLVGYLNGVKHITGVDFNITKGAHYPEVIIDNNLFNRLSKSLSLEFNFIDCGYKMTGEDFGFFSHKIPSFMAWLGTSKGERVGLHNPKFLPDDDVIEIGRKVYQNILEEFIK